MGSRSPSELLELPVRQHGIRLGRAVDVLLDEDSGRALGVVVLCGDSAERFLVLDAADVEDGEIVVSSAFLLLDDVDFYRRRAHSVRP